mmetsp:Transcript_49910/g.99034  ORF Transcript_49910/g.99034 Transcript_49910/m.99034 type:complete len:386 (-) Transcript_49910:162-1319(-)
MDAMVYGFSTLPQLQEVKQGFPSCLDSDPAPNYQNSSSHEEDGSTHLAACRNLEHCLGQLRQDISSEARLRAADSANFSSSLEAFSHELGMSAKDLRLHAKELQGLRESVKSSAMELDSIKESIRQAITEQRQMQLRMSESLGSLREALLKESADRIGADDAISQSWRLALDREKSDWMLANTALRSLVNALEKDVAGINEVFFGIRQRMLELEKSLIAQASESKNMLEQEIGEKVQQRLAGLSLQLDVESHAHKAEAEEVRRVLRTFRQKMGSELAHQAEFSRSTWNELNTQLQDLRAHSPLEVDRAVVEDQLFAERQHQKENELKQSQAFTAQLLELRSEVYAKLCQERDLQQARVAVLQERLDMLEAFFQDARALFLRNQSW